MKLKAALKSLLCSYAVTGLALLLLAFLLYQFDLGEKVITAGIVIIYVLSSFTGGFLIGKNMQKQKYLWGLLIGLCYFLLLIGVSWMVERQWDMGLRHAAATLLLCLAGGTLGGMIS